MFSYPDVISFKCKISNFPHAEIGELNLYDKAFRKVHFFALIFISGMVSFKTISRKTKVVIEEKTAMWATNDSFSLTRQIFL